MLVSMLGQFAPVVVVVAGFHLILSVWFSRASAVNCCPLSLIDMTTKLCGCKHNLSLCSRLATSVSV